MKTAKRLASILLSLVMVFALAPAGVISVSAADAEGVLTFKIENGEAIVVSCDAEATGELIIPNTYQGYPVTTIGEKAFSAGQHTKLCLRENADADTEYYINRSNNCAIGCDNLTGIVFPDSITTIEEGAFFGCEGILNITIPNGVTKIEENAFCHCESLETLTIPGSISRISNYAFDSCYGLKTLILQEGVTCIGQGAFDGSYKLETVYLPKSIKEIEGYPFFREPDNVYYSGSESDVTDIDITYDHGRYSLFDGSTWYYNYYECKEGTHIYDDTHIYCIKCKWSSISSLSVTTMPEKSTYYYGDRLMTSGMEVTATFNDGTTDLINGWQVDDIIFTKSSSGNITVLYGNRKTSFFVNIQSLKTPRIKVSNANQAYKLSWSAVSGADEYIVYRRMYSKGKYGGWKRLNVTTSTSYVDDTAKEGYRYQYGVKSVNGAAKSSLSNKISVMKLSTPKVTIANISKGIKVSWKKVTGAKKYVVYCRLGSRDWEKVKTTTATSFTDTGVINGKSYTYRVKAVNSSVESKYKTTASICRLKASSSIKLTKATKGFKLTWDKVTGAKKYEVYRRTGSGSWKKIKTTTSRSYVDKTARKGKYYTYKVRAVNGSSKSLFKTGKKTKR